MQMHGSNRIVKLISKTAAAITGTDVNEPCTKGGGGGGGLIMVGKNRINIKSSTLERKTVAMVHLLKWVGGEKQKFRSDIFSGVGHSHWVGNWYLGAVGVG